MSNWYIVVAPVAALRLEQIAKETGRSVENLIAAAAENEAAAYFAKRDDDPAEVFRGSLGG